MGKELIKKLRSIKSQDGLINPDRVWVAQNRVKLLENVRQSAMQMQAEAQPEKITAKFAENISEGLNVFFSRRVLSLAHTSMTVFLIGALTVGSWIASVSASYDSLPGQIMYSVKMANEGTELLVANMIGSEKDKVSTILKHASHRVDEYQRSESEEQATQAIASLKKKIESSSVSLIEAEKESPKSAVEVAKVIEEKTEEILVALSNEESVTGTKLALQNDMVNVEGIIQDAGIKAVEMIVKKVEQKEVGEDVITTEELKQTIAKRLDQLVSDVSRIEEKNNVSSSTINIVKMETASSTEAIASLTILNSATSTPITASSTIAVENPTKKVTEASQKVDEATKKVEETNQKVEETKVTVTGLIEQNNLSGALEKLKELSGAKIETKAVVTEALNAVNQVVQDAKDVKDAITPLSAPENVIISPSSTLNALVPLLPAPSSTIITPATTSSSTVEIKIEKTN